VYTTLNQIAKDESFGIDNVVVTYEPMKKVTTMKSDFTKSMDGWNCGKITSCGKFGKLCGGYGVKAKGAEIKKTFKLPASTYTVTLDFIKLDSWDNERAHVSVNGKQCFNKVLHYSRGVNVCGNGNGGFKDEKIKVTCKGTLSKAGPLTVRVYTTLNQDAKDESFGIDNVVVTYSGAKPNPALKCAAGSASNCKVTDLKVKGYSAGKLVSVMNGKRVRKVTEKDSCPKGFKIWSPRNKNDWTLVYNAMKKNINNYPKKPHNIVDVTRPANSCGGCTKYAMKSTTAQQGSWTTRDGSAWWLRDARYNEPNGNYHANCYLHIYDVNPNNVRFDDNNCNFYSSNYLCQPMQKAKYKFAFNGCCRGSRASSWKLKGTKDMATCKKMCTADKKCHAVEVNGCLKNNCKGNCWHFYGNEKGSLINGGCQRNGDMKCYSKQR